MCCPSLPRDNHNKTEDAKMKDGKSVGHEAKFPEAQKPREEGPVASKTKRPYYPIKWPEGGFQYKWAGNIAHLEENNPVCDNFPSQLNDSTAITSI
jgi:hypothetical protein